MRESIVSEMVVRQDWRKHCCSKRFGDGVDEEGKLAFSFEGVASQQGRTLDKLLIGEWDALGVDLVVVRGCCTWCLFIIAAGKLMI